MRHVSSIRAAAALAAVVAVLPVFGGPLNPPAGPIAPTHKTLTEVEPRRPISAATTPGDATNIFIISQPGSYYLTDSVTASGGKHGIRVTVSNVTIDLAGFALVGDGTARTGIYAGTGTNVTVRNGQVSNWGQSGVDLFTITGTLIEGITSNGNAEIGIRSGSAGVIRFCTATNNGLVGIVGFNGGVIEACNAFNNSGDGFSVGTGSTVRGCLARDNSGNGIDCSGGNAVVVHCTARGNMLAGINTQNSSVIEACVSNSNNTDGIRATGNCLIRNNVCNSNAAGIRIVQSSDNRIEGNNLTDNVQGLDVDTAGNFIVRNTCSGNGTNWNIVAGNALAPIVSAATNGAAVAGNVYAGSLGNTDPNANFTY